MMELDTSVSVKTSFFNRRDWSAFWAAFLVSFGVYFYTLAPTVTMEDCGELATAGTFLGIPHPPGYPIWTILAWGFTKIFGFVTFRGQPNPAWCIALASAVFGAISTGITSMLICRSGADIINLIKNGTKHVGRNAENAFCWIGGVAASLLFAFSPINWSQSVIVEVYSLNAFFLALILIIAYMWMKQPSDRTLVILSFVFGVGLTNYQALLLMLPALVVIVMVRNTSLFRDFIVTGIPYILVYILISVDFLPKLVHPANFTYFLYLSLNFLLLVFVYYFLPNGRTVSLSIIGLELGLAVYGYMPLASETNPPMNWGYPRTFEGFIHAITRAQYEQISPADIFSIQFVRQIGNYLSDVRAQFTLLVAPLGMLPLVTWEVEISGRRIKAIHAAIPIFMAVSILIVIEELIRSTGIPAITFTYKTLLCILALIQLVGILTLFTGQLANFKTQLRDEATPFSEKLTVMVVLLLGFGTFLAYETMLASRLTETLAHLQHAAGKAVSPAQFHTIPFKSAGIILMMIIPPILETLVICLYRARTRLRLAIDNDSQKWIISTLCSFLVMSILFIALANPTGDIQDYFIQRVKFISSHALYAFWIGYGIIFGLTIVAMFFKGKRLVVWAGVAITALLPLIPLKENAFNREQIRIVGGAEQELSA